MINDPHYNLPKDAFVRLFDNPIPADDPARSEAPEWAQELDEVVVRAHMGDDGEVTVFVNGEEAGGGGEAYDNIQIEITNNIGTSIIFNSLLYNQEAHLIVPVSPGMINNNASLQFSALKQDDKVVLHTSSSNNFVFTYNDTALSTERLASTNGTDWLVELPVEYDVSNAIVVTRGE